LVRIFELAEIEKQLEDEIVTKVALAKEKEAYQKLHSTMRKE
jgi:hypothetical protein